MSRDLTKLTKQLAEQMARIAGNQDKSKELLGIFMGLGIALGQCYTIATGRPFNSIKPIELLKWAIDLPSIDKETRSVTLH